VTYDRQVTKTAKIAVLAVAGGLGIALVPAFLPTGFGSSEAAAGLLAGGRFFVAALLIFGTGLLTALTPCVYPLIPITVGVFGARKAESKGKATLLTSSYQMGMSVVFTGLGIFAALSGKAFGSVLGLPVVAVGLAIFLLVLAASMFGAWDFTLPSGLTQRLNSVGGAGLLGAFLMGSVSGFLAAPCTGPVLTALLAYVAKTQNVALGGGLLFIYSLGIGVPFFLIGVFAMRLPKSGEWMDWVKSVFGIALVALAGTYLRDAYPSIRGALSSVGEQLGQRPGMWLMGAVTAGAVALGAVHLSFKGASSGERVLKGAAVALIVVAFLFRMAALNAPPQGALWARLGWGHAPSRGELTWDFEYPKQGAGVAKIDAVLARAAAEHRPVMMDFGAEWCASCKELERDTYVAPEVVRASRCFLNVKVDATDETDDIDALYQRYGIQGLPTVLFFGPEGGVLDAPRVTGYLKPEHFLAQMEKVPGPSLEVCLR
jgi:thiol:disulfide interchange protein DsbD